MGAQARIPNCHPSQHFDQDHDASGAGAANAFKVDAVELRADAQWATNARVHWALSPSVLRWRFVATGRLAGDKTLSARYPWTAPKKPAEFTPPVTFSKGGRTSIKAILDIGSRLRSVPTQTSGMGGPAKNGLLALRDAGPRPSTTFLFTLSIVDEKSTSSETNLRRVVFSPFATAGARQ